MDFDEITRRFKALDAECARLLEPTPDAWLLITDREAYSERNLVAANDVLLLAYDGLRWKAVETDTESIAAQRKLTIPFVKKYL